jgi:hypothetical protein
MVDAQITGSPLHQGVVAAHIADEQTHRSHVRGIGDAAFGEFLVLHYGLLSLYVEFKILTRELSTD